MVPIRGRRGRSRGAGAGPGAGLAIERTVELAMAGEADAVVTAPVHKPALAEAGFHPGHTEMLAALSGAPLVGMLMCDERRPAKRVLLATVHVPLAEVPKLVTAELLVAQTRLLAAALQSDWGIATPRIALCALNPHASDEGMFGDEEREVYGPALSALAREPWPASGPLPADTVFSRAFAGEFDAVVAPYHDVGDGRLQDRGVRTGRERDDRPSLRSHVARPRHRIRHRGPGRGGPVLDDGGGAVGGPAGTAATLGNRRANDGGRLVPGRPPLPPAFRGPRRTPRRAATRAGASELARHRPDLRRARLRQAVAGPLDRPDGPLHRRLQALRRLQELPDGPSPGAPRTSTGTSPCPAPRAPPVRPGSPTPSKMLATRSWRSFVSTPLRYGGGAGGGRHLLGRGALDPPPRLQASDGGATSSSSSSATRSAWSRRKPAPRPPTPSSSCWRSRLTGAASS